MFSLLRLIALVFSFVFLVLMVVLGSWEAGVFAIYSLGASILYSLEYHNEHSN